MIFILHGTDSQSSYKKLQNLLSTFRNRDKTQFDSQTTEEEINLAFLNRDLFENTKTIVLKNALVKNKNLPRILENAPKDFTVICWEDRELSKTLVSKLAKIARIENFKLPARIFQFLDSISPGYKKIIKDLLNLGQDPSLIYNLQHRFLVLSLAKLKVDLSLVSKITAKNIADWQWTKIRNQSRKFELESLIKIYNATLKIDYLIKNGQTTLPPSSLLVAMLLKYL